MYYFISVIIISILPTGEPVMERAVTGPFPSQNACSLYTKVIEDIVKQVPTSYIIEAECKKEDKGKAV
tara:strand:+ start:10178 stop:10381 length:204 start_codon:yes stop_codon:yes gene_type:complete